MSTEGIVATIVAALVIFIVGIGTGQSEERQKWEMTCVERNLGHYVVKNNKVVFEWLDKAEK